MAADIGRILQLNPPSVRLDDLVADEQAETEASTRRSPADEPLDEDLATDLRRDSRSAIDDVQRNRAMISRYGHVDRCTAVVQRVLDQIVHDLLHTERIPLTLRNGW